MPGAKFQNDIRPAPKQAFFRHGGIAIDVGTGNVYVTDLLNNRLQVYNSNDAFLNAWGSEGT